MKKETSWEFKGTKFFLVRKKTSNKSNKSKKKEILVEDFFQKIASYNHETLVSVKQGKIISDPLNILKVVQNSLKRGEFIGTKEKILRNLNNISVYLKKADDIKMGVLSNTYNSFIDFIQASFIKNNLKLPIPKEIPGIMRKNKSKLGIDEKTIKYSKEIIDYYKKVEKSEKKNITGKELEDLRKKVSHIKSSLS